MKYVNQNINKKLDWCVFRNTTEKWGEGWMLLYEKYSFSWFCPLLFIIVKTEAGR